MENQLTDITEDQILILNKQKQKFSLEILSLRPAAEKKNLIVPRRNILYNILIIFFLQQCIHPLSSLRCLLSFSGWAY